MPSIDDLINAGQTIGVDEDGYLYLSARGIPRMTDETSQTHPVSTTGM